MNSLRICLILGLLQPVLAQDGSGDAEQGAGLFYDFGCYGCHGYNATMRVPLVGDASGIMSSEALFLNYLRLRADQNPINPKNAMPNYAASTLSNEQARDIYAYIRSIDDEPPEVADIAVMQELLDAVRDRASGKEN